MKRSVRILSFFTALLALLVIFTSCKSNKIQLIIRGDDIGSSEASNIGCIKSYKDGIETSVEIIVPGPYFHEAVKLLNQNKGLDVGIHLALTSEWENIKWGPLTNCPSLVDNYGHFFPMVWPNENYHEALSDAKWVFEEIKKELRAQIDTALKYIPQCSHISSHMVFHKISPEVEKLIYNLAGEYNLKVNIDYPTDNYIDLFGGATNEKEMVNNTLIAIKGLKPGLYEFIEHPGFLSPDVIGGWHLGLENAPVVRDAVTKTFTNPEIKEAIKANNIELIGYNDL